MNNESESDAIPLDPLPEESQNNRLWIGNLDSRLTEYHLLKILQKFGHIDKFDLLFHRNGPLEGQPRGYAFVTYSTTTDAMKAKEKLDNAKLGAKQVSVKWAHSINETSKDKVKLLPEIPALIGVKKEKHKLTENTIRQIEAKLKTMESSETTDDFSISNRPSTSMESANSNKSRYYDRRKPYIKKSH